MEKSVQSWHRSLVFFHHLISLFALASTFHVSAFNALFSAPS